LNMQGSAGQRRVPTDFIRAYPLVVPENPDERQMIGSLLDEASTEIQHHKQQIIKLRTEKKALMQQLLTGKRRVAV
jgi:type I restriction enzyme S subunit